MSVAYIKLFFSYRTDFEALDYGEIGRLLMGALTYAETHEEPIFSGNEKFIWPLVRGQIDRDQTSYKKKSQILSDNARKRYSKSNDSANAYKSIQMHANADKTKNKNKDKTKKEDEFNLFWSAYPKKKSKADAFKVWSKLNPPLDKVLDAINKQKQSADWIKENGQYIPYPSKWLNGMCWEDEVQQGALFGHVHIDATDSSSYESFTNQINELNEYD